MRKKPTAPGRMLGVILLIGLLLGMWIGVPLPVHAQAGVCDNAPQARLQIGGWATVTPAVTQTGVGALKLRAEPRTTGEEIAVLPAGTTVRVLDGPACNDGFQWWRLFVVDTGDEGWSAEGLAAVYYLAPSAAPPPTPAFVTNTPIPADAPAAATPIPGQENVEATCPGETAVSYLSVGASARTADQGYPVRLRNEPAAESLFLQAVYQDQVITITDGPLCAEDRRWWQVQVGGRMGWTVEAANGRYLLIDPNNPPPAIDYAGGLTEVPPPPVITPPPDFTIVPTARPVTPPAVVKRTAYTPEGALLAIGDGSGLRLYDTAGYALLNTINSGPVIDFVEIGGTLYAITWASEGIRVVEATTGTIRTVLVGGPYDPAWAAASPDGRWLILGPTSDGATATLWDLNAATQPQIAPYWWPGWGVIRAAFSPNGQYVIINASVNTLSCEIDGTGCRFDILRNDFVGAGIFGDVSWSGDGSWMAGFSDRFWLWDGNGIGLGFTLRSTLTRQDPRQIALNTDGTRGAIIARRLMEVWTLADGNYTANRVVELPDSAHSLEYRPDGTQFVVAAGASVIVYEPVNGDVIQAVE